MNTNIHAIRFPFNHHHFFKPARHRALLRARRWGVGIPARPLCVIDPARSDAAGHGQRELLLRVTAWFLALCVWMVVAHSASAATLTGVVLDTRGQPATTNITFTPLSTPQSVPPGVIISSVQTAVTDTNGNFSQVLQQGSYKVTVGGNSKDAFLIAVPNSDGTNLWTDLITSQLVYAYPFQPQYEEKRNKGATNGYAGLNSAALVPPSQLGIGTPTPATFLRGDNAWVAPESGIACANGFATNLTARGILSLTNYALDAAFAPISPTEGATWNDASQRARMMVQGGLRQSVQTVLYTLTNCITCTNGILETSLLAGGIGSVSIPANFLVPGKTIRFRLFGIYSTPAGLSSLTLRFKVANTVYMMPISYSGALANKIMSLEFQWACIAGGSSGAYVSAGELRNAAGVSLFNSAANPQNLGGPLDATQPSTLDVTATHSLPTCSMTITQLAIEVLN